MASQHVIYMSSQHVIYMSSQHVIYMARQHVKAYTSTIQSHKTDVQNTRYVHND